MTDQTGAVVVGAAVTATNTDTNVSIKASSNAEGNYEIALLIPGLYRLSAEMAGFKSWSRSDVELRGGVRLGVDIRLEIGSVTEVAQVTATVPILDVATAGVGSSLDSKLISNIPLRSGNVMWLYASGVASSFTAIPRDGPWNPDDSANLRIAGGGVDYNMDGVSNNAYGGRNSFIPPAEMVADVRIDSQAYDAAVGHTTGGAVNVTLKSGGNQLRGVVGASMSGGPMITRNFFVNQTIFNPATGPLTPQKINSLTPSVKWLREDVAIGGPVYIPHLYDGHNKTFWQFGFQRAYRRRGAMTQATVPTAAEAKGDFSAQTALGNQYTIYDPRSTTPVGNGRFSRQPFPKNIIPGNQLSAMGLKIASMYPSPNSSGTADGTNNYNFPDWGKQNLKQYIARVDQNFSANNRFFARYTQTDFAGVFDHLVPNSNIRGCTRERPQRGIALDDVVVLSSTLLFDVRYGFTWFRENQYYDNHGYNIASLGFPDSLIRQLDPGGIAFPQISVSSHLQLGQDGGWYQSDYSHNLLAVLTWTRGGHSIRFGFDARRQNENYHTWGNVTPAQTFTCTYTVGPLDNNPCSPNGKQGLASLLLGIPSGGGSDLNSSYADSSPFYAPFVQDDWRITSKLTLNIGFRWEYTGPVVERYNRSARQFDFAVANPIQAQAQAAYAKSPIPEIAASQFRTPGGVTFTGAGGNPRAIRNPYHGGFMPRFGFAYSIDSSTVLRGGYGMFYDGLGVEKSNVTQPGFSRRTNIVPSTDNGMTYQATIDNPLPGGLVAPKGATGGLATFLGASPGFFVPEGQLPYTQRWSLTVQKQVQRATAVEVGYIGSKSVRLQMTRDFNTVPAGYLSTLPVRDQAVINNLTSQVANPFRGIDGFQGTAFYTSNTLARSQLLLPYPEFGSLTASMPAGSSWYHALTTRVDRRFAAGLQLQATYTFSKQMEAISYLNPTNATPEHVIGAQDRPHNFSLNSVFELPFGANRRFARSSKGLLNHIIGGWDLDVGWTLYSGPPLGFGNVLLAPGAGFDNLASSQPSLQRAFNTSLFVTANSAQLANNIRTLSSRTAKVRSDGLDILNAAVHKVFRIHERAQVELRGEAEGLMNHPNFASPNTTPTSTLFGQITGTQGGEEDRRVFVGLKVRF